MGDETHPGRHYEIRSWHVETGVVAAACLALGTFLTVEPILNRARVAQPADRFTQADFDAFDREFELDGVTCEVGLARDKLCLGKSPLEAEIKRGHVLPHHIPVIGAEFRVIVNTPLKRPGLQTARFGQTLVLIDPESRRVEDVLDLMAPDYVAAPSDRSPPKA
ncbi:hypothetical protein [Hyphomonas johnsonii]|uniref:Uncharacterized protein n=1 Tax=Hyphomonas johnsonii MHS-2 TaxID=1280950 RepID=A0A059FTY2_9PROT|nr:hypothetical protein [Hyphomonas johnsonii]KCZ93923.1 hypothetical protein HJO_01070 [Hyphomonas johnsonii MHS-2]